jgi:RNA polymerase sigma factor (sigma-70 family)
VKGDSAIPLEELERLYRDRFARYLRVAEAITGDPERGLDAVQEGFAQAIRSREGFRGDASLSTWVWRCVVNAAKDSRALDVQEAAAVEPEAPANENSSALELRKLIAALPERQRLTLFLRHYADLDYASIASVLNVELGTVGATLNRAHAALRQKLRLKEVHQ